MKRKRTATTANAILGLLALRPSWSTYSITKQLRRNMRFFWPRVESRIYNEARQLIARGLVQAFQEHVGRRARTVYSITSEGQQELEEWLATAPSATKLECEPLLRVFLGDLCTEAQLHAALAQVRADADAILSVGRVVGPEYIAGTAPFQDQVHVRALVFDFLWNHAKMLEQWADRTETTIGQWKQLSPAERAEAALATINRNLETD
ncbi:MAG TPA: PadR family transcriptional regulator [Chloroflexia bacterium]|nr:PadR family transcriptional regulator [Chloroflexia bacterium]